MADVVIRGLKKLGGCPRCKNAVLRGSCLACGWQLNEPVPPDILETMRRPTGKRGPLRMGKDGTYRPL